MAHFNEDLKHYHLLVQYGNRIFEISEVFRHSNKSRNISTATVGEIKTNIHGRFDDDDDKIKNNNFYLTWKGKKLEPDTLKIRDIEVDGERLPLHLQNTKNPIEIHFGNGNDVPSIVPDVASASDDEKTDYNQIGIENQKKNQNKPQNYIEEQRAKNLEKKRQREEEANKKLAKGEGKKSKATKKRFVKKRKHMTKSK
jgi:hypothetical protein